MTYTQAFERMVKRIHDLVRVADASPRFKRPEMFAVHDLLRWSQGLTQNLALLDPPMREGAIAQMVEGPGGIRARLKQADGLFGPPGKFDGTPEDEAICEVMEALWEFNLAAGKTEK